ncbi:MAG TPA: PrsW family intramembrane metalloprotease, partial [Actinomycetota bacterium]
PISLVIAALLWGGVGATALSIFGNTGWALVVADWFGPEVARSWTAALTAPWVEEIFKALGIVLIYLIARREIDDVMDGFVYGAMVGLGFTLVEDVFYFLGAFGGEVEGVLTGFYLRVIASGFYGHVLYSALAGMGIAYFVTRKGVVSEARRWAVPTGLFLIAVLAHFLWNSPLLDLFPEEPWEGTDWLVILLATAVKGLPLLVFVVLMVRLAQRREHRWLRAALETEVGRPGLTREELEALDHPVDRRRARREAAARGGPRAAKAMKKLQREQVNLAMVATRTHDPDHPDVLRQHVYCAELRAWVRRLMASSEGEGARPSGGPPPGEAPPPPPPGATPPGSPPPPST